MYYAIFLIATTRQEGIEYFISIAVSTSAHSKLLLQLSLTWHIAREKNIRMVFGALKIAWGFCDLFEILTKIVCGSSKSVTQVKFSLVSNFVTYLYADESPVPRLCVSTYRQLLCRNRTSDLKPKFGAENLTYAGKQNKQFLSKEALLF